MNHITFLAPLRNNLSLFKLGQRKFLRWIVLFLIFSIPFGTKKFFFAFNTPFGEKISAFLYGADILIFALFGILIIYRRQFVADFLSFVRNPLFVIVVLFLVIVGFSFFTADYQFVALYNFARLILLIIMALGIGFVLKSNLVKFVDIAFVFSFSAVFQALVAFFQFKFQHSLGLRILGESFVTPFMPEVAKVIIEGGKLIRGYGTMSHANILAGFLILGLVSLYYLFLRLDTNIQTDTNNTNNVNKFFLIIGIFIVCLGLIITFSRSGWIVASIITLFMLFFGILNKIHRRQTISLTVILFFIFCFLFFTMSWAILPRLTLSYSEPSVNYRILYNEIGLETIREHPFGVGIGNQLLYGVKYGLYQDLGMENLWEWQPTHNLYILIASEVGIIGLLLFLLLVGKLIIDPLRNNLSAVILIFWATALQKFFNKYFVCASEFLLRLARKIFKFQRENYYPVGLIANYKLQDGKSARWQITKLEFITNCSLLITILLFGFFDHFMWDLWQGQLMLWAILGIMMGSCPHNSMDRAQVSGT